MTFIEVDASRRPVIIFTVNPVDPSDAQLSEFFAEFERVLAESSRRVFLLFDLTNAMAVGISKLRKVGAFLGRVEGLLQSRVQRTAIVVTNVAVKGCVHVVFTFHGPKRPWDTFASEYRAVQWFAKPHRRDLPDQVGG